MTRAYMAATIALVVVSVGGGLYALYAERKTKRALRAMRSCSVKDRKLMACSLFNFHPPRRA